MGWNEGADGRDLGGDKPTPAPGGGGKSASADSKPLGGPINDNKVGYGDTSNYVSATLKGVELNSNNYAKSYESKYGTREVNRAQRTAQVRSSMKSTAKWAGKISIATTIIFGILEINEGVQQDGGRWGYNTNVALGSTLGGAIGSYYGASWGAVLGTGSSGPGAGTVAGGIVGSIVGGNIGSGLGESFVKLFYNSAPPSAGN